LDGEVCETKEEMNGIVQNFYTGLYSAPEQIDVNAVLNSVPVKVTREMNVQAGPSSKPLRWRRPCS
jgi:hypothetical protein